MYVVRDIFHLKFAHYRDVKALLDQAEQMGMFPDKEGNRMLTDFTGDSYRLIMEQSFKTLAEYEQMMSEGMGKAEWQQWYMKFKEHINTSQREILKLVM